MKTLIIIILLGINTSAFADTKVTDNLAKLDVPAEKSKPGLQAGMLYPRVNVIEVFKIFLLAVDRGQLKLFDKTLSREMVKPIRVEYIYTVETPHPQVKVYSELKKPMSIPSIPDANIIGVSGVMDASGNIIETTAHCDIEG